MRVVGLMIYPGYMMFFRRKKFTAKSQRARRVIFFLLFADPRGIGGVYLTGVSRKKNIHSLCVLCDSAVNYYSETFIKRQMLA